jgi:hypothetical protein
MLNAHQNVSLLQRQQRQNTRKIPSTLPYNMPQKKKKIQKVMLIYMKRNSPLLVCQEGIKVMRLVGALVLSAHAHPRPELRTFSSPSWPRFLGTSALTCPSTDTDLCPFFRKELQK